jgi:predicted nucleic acid-binding protein
MPDRVIDASVLGAAFFKERRYQEAYRLISSNDLFAPNLVGYEMSSIACKKLEESPHQSQAIQEALRLFLQMEIRWMDVDYSQVVNLAVATGLTAYDASYLYVSRELNIPLITFDSKLAMVARNWGGR